MRKKIVAGNWKMNLNKEEAHLLFNDLESTDFPKEVVVIISPPSIYLDSFSGATNIFISSQDVSCNENGAYTGEFSSQMLSSLDIKYSIVGHSERRQYHNESNDLIFQKTKMLIQQNISPLFCCGESLEERKSENHYNIVKSQLNHILNNLNAPDFEKIIIAYEPVWAIGTGLTANPSDAQSMHSFIRSLVKDSYGDKIADNLSILYGGSCKPSNSIELFSMEDIDGGLIGGASLDSKSFESIINSF